MEKLSKKNEDKGMLQTQPTARKHSCFLARGTEKSGHTICVQEEKV